MVPFLISLSVVAIAVTVLVWLINGLDYDNKKRIRDFLRMSGFLDKVDWWGGATILSIGVLAIMAFFFFYAILMGIDLWRQ
jgi:hypothetical protein